MQFKDVIYAAARAARVLTRAGSVLNASELADGLTIGNQIVDQWSGRRAYTYADVFSLFNLTPGTNPYLIGPGLVAPNFAVANRPVKLEQEGASLVLTDSVPAVDVPMNVRDADWWNEQRVKTLTTNVPTDVYYEPDFPNGSLYFWPVPDFAYQVRLRLRSVLGQYASITATFTAPPAYQLALVLTMAELMCTWWGIPVPAGLPAQAMTARRAVHINNIKSPRIASADYGTRGKSGGADFNYYTGLPTSNRA